MHISLIVAVADNGVIGRDNELPWHLPGDLQYFKRTTLGKPVLMGRKTRQAIGRALPGRTNIVISRQQGLELESTLVVNGLDAALALAEQVADADGVDELMVIGGAEIYALALPVAQKLYLTEVHAEVTGDAWFPDWDRLQWREISRERHDACDSNPYDFSFVVYERR